MEETSASADRDPHRGMGDHPSSEFGACNLGFVNISVRQSTVVKSNSSDKCCVEQQESGKVYARASENITARAVYFGL